MASPLEVYDNLPLRQGSNVNRLLHVFQSNTFDAQLTCDVEVASLDDEIDFTALSYTWGKPIFDKFISLNDCPFAITQNLEAALRRFRKTGEQVIWVDQICIDQSNVPEKSHQITLMRRVYSQARRVFVYLGEGDDYLATGIDLAKSLAAKQSSFQDFINANRAANFQSENERAAWVASLPPNHVPSQDDPVWEAFLNIYTRPWFTRVWVVQEAASNADVEAFYGDSMVEYRTLLTARAMMVFLRAAIRFSGGENSNALAMFYIDSWLDILRRRKEGVLDLFEALLVSRRFMSTDPRDKIFALYGLAADTDKAPLPDYTQSTTQVYLKNAEHFISQGVGVRVLNAAGKHRQKLDLASWVPDWSNYTPLWDFARNAERRDQAAGDTVGSVELSDAPGRIAVQGAFIDTIIDVGPIFVLEDFHRIFPDFNKLFLEWDAASRVFLAQTSALNDADFTQRLTTYSRALMLDDPKVKSPLSAYASAWQFIREGEDASVQPPFKPGEEPEATTEEDRVNFTKAGFHSAVDRRLCVTERGHLGLASRGTRAGDRVSIFFGMSKPAVLRKADDSHIFVGDAFILDFMKGEALEMDDFIPEDIILR